MGHHQLYVFQKTRSMAFQLLTAQKKRSLLWKCQKMKTSEEAYEYVSEINDQEVIVHSEKVEIKEEQLEAAAVDLMAEENHSKKMDATKIMHDEVTNEQVR